MSEEGIEDRRVLKANKRLPESPIDKEGSTNKKRNTEELEDTMEHGKTPAQTEKSVDDAIVSIAAKVSDCVVAQAESVTSLNLQANKIADNRDELEYLRAENKALTKRLDTLEAVQTKRLDNMAAAQKATDEKIDQVDRTVTSLSHTIKNANIVVDGITEKQGENCKMSVTKILQIIESKFSSDDIISAYRIGQTTEDRPRPMVVKFYDALVKQIIMDGKWKLMKDKKGDKIFINDDLPPQMKHERRILCEICKYAHKIGYENCKASGSKLVVNGKAYRYSTLHLLPPELQPANIKTRPVGNGLGFQGEESFLSNFFPVTLTVEKCLFSSSEQAFQYFKAITCKKDESAAKILSMANPRDIKLAGDNIPAKAIWECHKEAFMRSIVHAKFTQNPEIKKRLLDTKDLPLMECTKNRWWGCGWRIDAPEWEKQSTYPGLNKMGKILMEVRAALSKGASEDDNDALNKSPTAIIKSIQNINQAIQEQCGQIEVAEMNPEEQLINPDMVHQPQPMDTEQLLEEKDTTDTTETDDEELLAKTDIEEDTVDISSSSSNSSSASKSAGNVNAHNLTTSDGKLNIDEVKSWSIPKLDTSRLELSTSYISGRTRRQRIGSASTGDSLLGSGVPQAQSTPQSAMTSNQSPNLGLVRNRIISNRQQKRTQEEKTEKALKKVQRRAKAK